MNLFLRKTDALQIKKEIFYIRFQVLGKMRRMNKLSPNKELSFIWGLHDVVQRYYEGKFCLYTKHKNIILSVFL